MKKEGSIQFRSGKVLRDFSIQNIHPFSITDPWCSQVCWNKCLFDAVL